MANERTRIRQRLATTGILMSALVSGGCQVLGPAALSSGRGTYSDVVARTNAEQTLGMIVRLRYSDPIVLMSVSSITASLKFGAEGRAEFGAGPQSNYSGNLVPFSAGLSYEDSPTISYAPVASESFVREWLSPISLETLVLGLQGSDNARALLPLLVAQMNELRSSLSGGEISSKFDRLASLLGDLHATGAATWGRSPSAADRFVLTLSKAMGGQDAQIGEVLELLGVPAPAPGTQLVELPLEIGVHRPGEAKVLIQTHAVAELVRAASMAIEVPAEHVSQGVVQATPDASGIAPPIFQIRSSKDAPKHAAVAVKHRGVWFYIDDTDLRSKHAFQTTEMLFMMRLADAERGTQHAPVLTLPVG